MPDDPFAEAVVCFNAGLAYLTSGAKSHAETSFRQAIDLAPELAEAHANLALVLDQQGSTGLAESSYRHALSLNPDLLQVHQNLGVLLANQRRFAEAAQCYQQALQRQPDNPTIWSNLGVLHASEKREAEAEECHRHALMLDPTHRSARFNLAYLLLRQGKYTEGFACLEARDWYAVFADMLSRERGIARWQGEALTGKSILITCEAGHGDMIHFCRYASELKSRGAIRVDVLCHPALTRLFTTLDGVDQVYALDQPWPGQGWDFWSPPLSLPHFCATRLETIPAHLPYLHATAADLAKWQPRLPTGGLRIGLAWKGNLKFENDAERSIPHITLLAPLWSVSGVHFVSLQKGAGEEEARTISSACPITLIGPELGDFADTAAVIEQLDLVICVDSAVAHLAGALGKPCWLLLPDFKTDWRWLNEREDSPWYPKSIKLFRQTRHGGWGPVIAHVCAALDDFVKQQTAHDTQA